MKSKRIKKIVREGYAKIAEQGSSCCGSANSCCGGVDVAQDISKKIGYTEEELKDAPEGANLGLGCGNPVALASLKKGETVLDLGSGAGFDSFLAAQKVGDKGRVIGVDMTPEMIKKAKENAKKGNYRNVEFRLGEIENLPLAGASVDVIISNCVINLSPDKERVFRESFRVLTLGGRLMISDIVLLRELPDYIRKSVEAYIGCLSGAIMKDKYIAMIKKAGFQNVKVINETSFPIELMVNNPTPKTIMKNLRVTAEKVKGIADSVVSISIQAKR
jgi:SAM-dependent methyltransferase